MNFEGGLKKLRQAIAARKQLEEKLKDHPDNENIKSTIARHIREEAFFKQALKFNEVFDVKPEVVEKIVKKKCSKCASKPKAKRKKNEND